MIEAAVNLMREANLARREHRLADAHRDLIQAVTLCRQAGVRRDLAQALKRLGQIERDLGDVDAARPLYEEAVTLCRAEGDRLLLAHTIRHLGDIHRHEGHVDLAEPCYLEALTLYRSDEQTPPLDLANAIRPLAMIKENSADLEEARRLWEEARSLYAAVNIEAGVAECSARLARLARR